MTNKEEQIKFVDIWQHFNTHIETLCKKRKYFIAKILDESNQMIDEEDLNLVIETIFENLELRIKKGINDKSKWPSFDFLSKQRGEKMKPITRQQFEDTLKAYLKDKSLIDHLESFLPKVTRLNSPMIVDKKQSTLSKFVQKSPVKKLSPIEETEKDESDQTEEDEPQIKKKKRKTTNEIVNDVNIESRKSLKRVKKLSGKKSATKKAQANDSDEEMNEKADHTRCGIVKGNYEENKKDNFYHPFIIRKGIDRKDCGKWFILDEKKDKLFIDTEDKGVLDIHTNTFAIEGPIKDQVPDVMIEFFVRDDRLRTACNHDRKTIYQHMSPWLTKAQKVKWKKWSTKDWEDEYSNVF